MTLLRALLQRPPRLGGTAPLLIGLLLTILPTPVRGQDPPPPGGERVHGWVGIGAQRVAVSSQTSWMIGAVAGLRYRGWSVGGGGFGLTERTPLGAGLRLGLGVGGVTVEREVLETGLIRLGGSLLLGAGNVEVLNFQGTRLDADNFGVVEPGVHLNLPLGSFASFRLLAGYRFTFGTDALPGLGEDAVAGGVFGFFLRLGRSP